MPLSIKQRIIKAFEKILFFRLILFALLLFRKDIRKNSSRKTEIAATLFNYFIKAVHNQILFFVLGIANIIRERHSVLRIRKFFVSRIPCYKPFYYQIALPVNLEKADEKYFLNRDYFISKPLLLKTINNCHVFLATEFGIVFKKLHILSDSIHGKLDKRNIKILKSYTEMVFENYISNKFRKDGNIIQANDPQNYLLIHHWFNYYHWITETLYRYFSLPEEDSKKYTLVLPETLKESKFVNETLLTFSNVKTEYFPNNSIIGFKHINYITHKRYCTHYEPTVLHKIRAHFTNYIQKHQTEAPVKSKRLFISRRQAERRSIVNEEALIEKLQRYGFTAIDFEDYTFLEQVSIMQHCRCLAGVHGSGITNMLFMPEGGSIIELMPQPEVSKTHHSLVYWRLAGCLKHKYYYYFCKKKSANNMAAYSHRKYYYNTELHTFHLEVDIIEFEKQLTNILSLE
ncbi:MAG: hypothetical protein BWY70_01343 [Bacteroidetes bacterium ADurb.Bin408]|nr:MAG: hypothetical protein BWY70_01343 [Bacteroidetes bacterium ADurb.Bin408]